LRVADTYASMTAQRPFRQAIPAAEARKYLVEWAGIEFDPAVVKAFVSLAQVQQPAPAPVQIHATQ
jgi:HD-GYP domain-containing protein (c-di-GMP phosphodiesterase class II)